MHIQKVVASTSEWNSVIEGRYATKVIDWRDVQYRLNAFATDNSAFGVSLAVITSDDVQDVDCNERRMSLSDAQILADDLFCKHFNFMHSHLDCAFLLGADAEELARPSIGMPALSAVAG